MNLHRDLLAVADARAATAPFDGGLSNAELALERLTAESASEWTWRWTTPHGHRRDGLSDVNKH
jgi:hypothetical protein